MTISGVDLMRSARDKILHDTDGMSWSEEHAYLQARRGWYEASLEAKPNNSATSDRVGAGRRRLAPPPPRGGVGENFGANNNYQHCKVGDN
jgi:hypothetical protein